MLADRVDYIIGVDTHTATHTAAVVTPTGAALAHRTVPAHADGYLHIYRFAVEQAPGRRVWAIEGTGSYGAGLTTHLLEQGEWVVEVDRPARPARRNGAKTDDLDAVRAAREALGREHLAQPRQRGDREAIGVLVTTRQSATAGPHVRDQPPQGAGGQRTRAPAPAVARAGDRPAAGSLRPLAQPPNPADRISRHDRCPAPHRAALARPCGRS
jgi:hypothetical protein